MRFTNCLSEMLSKLWTEENGHWIQISGFIALLFIKNLFLMITLDFNLQQIRTYGGFWTDFRWIMGKQLNTTDFYWNQLNTTDFYWNQICTADFYWNQSVLLELVKDALYLSPNPPDSKNPLKLDPKSVQNQILVKWKTLTRYGDSLAGNFTANVKLWIQ